MSTLKIRCPECQSELVVDTETADVITGPKIYLNAVAED